jgi:ribosomal-protein-alanine N-acetyltransferase
MVRVEPLRADHADALLAFERENREYFASTIPDRGDAYFAEFAARHQALLDEQEDGRCRFHVVLDEQGELVGRINLVDVIDGTADLGYRIAEKAAGHGVATAAVAQLRRLAAEEYGLHTLTAATTVTNRASMTVLTRNGFTITGDIMLGSGPGIRFECPAGTARLGADPGQPGHNRGPAGRQAGCDRARRPALCRHSP